jgi:hypothetical protein
MGILQFSKRKSRQEAAAVSCFSSQNRFRLLVLGLCDYDGRKLGRIVRSTLIDRGAYGVVVPSIRLDE